ncbi:MAG: DUF6516 family protein [Candidatus Poribacteria bacterium]|nr:DUF6516 family protein [Candidatus Poribacteria bacterium]
MASLARRESKRRHEAARYFQEHVQAVYQKLDLIDRFDDPTLTVMSDGTGQIYLPSQSAFQRLTPHSPPAGIVFLDGSFLTVKEIFRYDYAHEDDTRPRIMLSEFSYHYHIPHRAFFFRYDHHPEVGDPATHPPYHLHVGCWHAGDDKLSALPRFAVAPVTLEAVLDLIERDFLRPSEFV